MLNVRDEKIVEYGRAVGLARTEGGDEGLLNRFRRRVGGGGGKEVIIVEEVIEKIGQMIDRTKKQNLNVGIGIA
jgi:hypothetical protein